MVCLDLGPVNEAVIVVRDGGHAPDPDPLATRGDVAVPATRLHLDPVAAMRVGGAVLLLGIAC